jgi:F0F1-type ATP synthase assembly protein I
MLSAKRGGFMISDFIAGLIVGIVIGVVLLWISRQRRRPDA